MLFDVVRCGFGADEGLMVPNQGGVMEWSVVEVMR